MPRFEAASISVHEAHLPHGSAVGPFSQFNAFARMRAAVVLPTPRAPEKMYACATRSLTMAFFRVSVTCCWPTKSVNVCGRHFRAMTWYVLIISSEFVRQTLKPCSKDGERNSG